MVLVCRARTEIARRLKGFMTFVLVLSVEWRLLLYVAFSRKSACLQGINTVSAAMQTQQAHRAIVCVGAITASMLSSHLRFVRTCNIFYSF